MQKVKNHCTNNLQWEYKENNILDKEYWNHIHFTNVKKIAAIRKKTLKYEKWYGQKVLYWTKIFPVRMSKKSQQNTVKSKDHIENSRNIRLDFKNIGLDFFF